MRPAPLFLALFVCAVLLATASMMAVRSLALAADGSFYLVRILGEDRVFGPDARFLANAVRQGPVLIAARAGVSDTHLLSLLLGFGQLVVPAIAWSAAILLSRSDRVVFAVVSLTAGLCAGATWLFNVSENVLAVPLTVLVAVLLWQPRPWRIAQAALAVAASLVLVASYETAILSGALLAAWATWRVVISRTRAERYGAAFVAVGSLTSIFTAAVGAQDPAQPSSGQAFLYHLVSVEPWQAYLALVGIWAFVLGSLVDAAALRWSFVAAGGFAVVVAIGAQDATSSSAYEARAAATLASFALVIFLWLRWVAGWRRTVESVEPARHHTELLVVPVAAVMLMLAPSVDASVSWARSFDAFRAQVARAEGVVLADEVLPEDRRDVLFDWTSTSLSLIARRDSTDGVLADRNPSLVAFAPTEARYQLSDKFSWG